MIRALHVTACLVILAGLTTPSMATLYSYNAVLNGPNEPTPSIGTGVATADYDDLLHTLRVQVSFSGLSGTVTAAHIHGPTLSPGTGTAGVATMTPTFLDFPSGVTSGIYDHTFDLTLASSYNGPFVVANGGTPAGAEAALASALAAGKTYLNIHTTKYGGGEIRGFLVPEPGTLAAAIAGAVAMFSLNGRRRRCSSPVGPRR
jgi:hypothetical protein